MIPGHDSMSSLRNCWRAQLDRRVASTIASNRCAARPKGYDIESVPPLEKLQHSSALRSLGPEDNFAFLDDSRERFGNRLNPILVFAALIQKQTQDRVVAQ